MKTFTLVFERKLTGSRLEIEVKANTKMSAVIGTKRLLGKTWEVVSTNLVE